MRARPGVGAVVAGMLALLCIGGPAVADGLQRFQQEMLPRIPKGILRYESAEAHGAAGFVLKKAVIVTSEAGRKTSSIRISQLSVEEIDFDRLGTNDSPHFARIRADGITEVGNREFDALRKRHGASMTPGALQLDYRFDPGSRTLVISKFNAHAPGLSRISFDAVLDNVRSLAAADRDRWAETAALRSLKLSYEDQSGLRFGVRVLAEQLGKAETAMIREWLAAIAVMSAGKGARTLAAADALVSFIQDHRRPTGTLRVAITPAKPMPLAQVVAAALSADPAQSLGLVVTYPGTRAGAAADLLKR